MPIPPAFARAFTLIELLVVVTIIAVLLAMMMPALDRAIGQATMAVCAANQSGVATGTVAYAMQFKRSYPHRGAIHDLNIAQVETRQLTVPSGRFQTSNLNGYDDRPMLRPFFSMKLLQCPFSGKLDLDSGVEEGVDTIIYATIMRFAGWQYVNRNYTNGQDTTSPVTPGTAVKGMLRLGDRWEWGEPSRIMGGDWYRSAYVFGTGIEASHPDVDGTLSLVSVQDWELDGINRAQRGDPDARYTTSYWYLFGVNNATDMTGVDLNFHYDDGSVERFDRLRWNHFLPLKRQDPRARWIPGWSDNNYAGRQIVPKNR